MRKGFTLIELIIVVGISLILTATVVFSVVHIVRSSGTNALSKEERLIAEQIIRYYTFTNSVPSGDNFYTFLKDTNYFPTMPENPLYKNNSSTPEKGWRFTYSTSSGIMHCTITTDTGCCPYSFDIYKSPGHDPTNVYMNKFNGKAYGGQDD